MPKTVHASVHLAPKVHRALKVKLAKEGRSISEFFRATADQYVSAK